MTKTQLNQLKAELTYLNGYSICDWQSDPAIGFALDARREKLEKLIDNVELENWACDTNQMDHSGRFNQRKGPA